MKIDKSSEFYNLFATELKNKSITLDEQSQLAVSASSTFSHRARNVSEISKTVRFTDFYLNEFVYQFPNDRRIISTNQHPNKYRPIIVNPNSGNTDLFWNEYPYNVEPLPPAKTDPDKSHLQSRVSNLMGALPDLTCSKNKKTIFHEVGQRLDYESIASDRPLEFDKKLALVANDLKFVRKGEFGYGNNYVEYSNHDNSFILSYNKNDSSFNIVSYDNFRLRKENNIITAYDTNWKVIAKSKNESDPWLRRFSAAGKLYSCYMHGDDRYDQYVYDVVFCYRVIDTKVKN